jgi:hypothetical protein
MSSLLPEPYKYKDWLIWKNTAFDNMEYNSVDCSDAAEGVCLENLSLQDCIDNSSNVDIGYYIDFKNGKSICVPLKTDLYPSLNFIYKLRNQSVHPKLNNVSISTFLNKKVYSFPPEYPNVIFYFDIIQLKNVETGSLFNTTNINNNYIEFNKDTGINLQFVPSLSSASELIKYKAIRYGDNFNIVLPGTSLILSKNIDNDNFVWKESSTINQKSTFQIVPLDYNSIYNKKLENKNVNYGDEFTIIYLLIDIVTLNKYNILTGEYGSIKQIVERGNTNIYNTFTCISKMIGYYCENDKCNPVKIQDAKILNIPDELGRNEAIYKNATVDRNENCWGACKYWNKDSNTLPEFKDIKFLEENDIKIDSFEKRSNIILFNMVLISIIITILLIYYFS